MLEASALPKSYGMRLARLNAAMSRLEIEDLPLSGLKKVRRKYLSDNRGYLTRLFCVDELESAGWTEQVAQINHTVTDKRGTVRGMHFQRHPDSEVKLVSCIRGEVWDVAVDLRVRSSTFLCWHAERLSAENGCALLIPKGFAHGFQTLTDSVELLYCHSQAFAVHSQDGLNPTDPRLAIGWPLAISELSARDAGLPKVADGFIGV